MVERIPQTFIDDLTDRSDITEIIGKRIEIKKAGKEYKACCPFHNEKTPSFTISPEKGFYHCFGCGAHGTSLGFLMDYEKLTFVEAIEELEVASSQFERFGGSRAQRDLLEFAYVNLLIRTGRKADAQKLLLARRPKLYETAPIKSLSALKNF